MASQNFCYTCQMLLIIFVVLLANTGSSASVVEIHKEVGGTAKFTCPNVTSGDLEFMYLQKNVGTGPIFVNGFHAQNPLEVLAMYRNRSIVYNKSRHVILQDLNPADEGQYYCVVRTKINSHPSTIWYQLTITASYSQPQLMEIHNDSTCSITCSSSGGYPRAEMEMVVVPELYKPMVTEKQTTVDSVTGLFSEFSAIMVNVSQPLSVTCIVGNRSSMIQNVCVKRTDPPRPDGIIILACLLVSVLFIVGLAVVLQRRRCSRSRSLVVMYSAAQRSEYQTPGPLQTS